jgi:hypothetical protein
MMSLNIKLRFYLEDTNRMKFPRKKLLYGDYGFNSSKFCTKYLFSKETVSKDLLLSIYRSRGHSQDTNGSVDDIVSSIKI